MKKRAIIRLFVLVLTLALAVAPVVCAQTAEAEEERFNLTITMWHDSAEFPAAGNEVELLLEELTNTDIELTAYGSDYNNIVATVFASGNLPDIVAIPTGNTPNYVLDAINAGMLWDIEGAINESTYLKQNNPVLYENLRIQGHIYALPKSRALVRRTFMYRKDWFDQLGLEVPTSVDSLYEACKAIKEAYPTNENGTTVYPLTIDKAFLNQWGTIFNAPNVWRRNEDGSYTRDATTQEYFDAMTYLKKLYDEGLLHPDFSILDRNRDVWGAFAEGTAAIIRDSSQQIGPCANKVYANYPDAEVSAFSLIAGPDGEIRTMGESGNNGYMLFTKGRYTEEEDMKKMVNFFDMMGSPEVSNLFAYGIEGKHYDLVDGVITPIAEMTADYEDTIRVPYRYTLSPFQNDFFCDEGVRNPFSQMEIDIDSATLNYMVPNQSIGMFSQTAVERGNLESIISDASLNYIMGVIDEATYWSEIERWRAEGGDQIAEEYAAYYAQYNG